MNMIDCIGQVLLLYDTLTRALFSKCHRENKCKLF
jgi:hypothetical protein